MSDASVWFLEELTGDRHTLSLTGRALPFRPISFEGEMRAQTTWYPGNPIGSLQMLGAKLNSTTMNGFWHDRFLKTFGDVPLPGVPEATVSVPIPQTGIASLDGSVLPDVKAIVDAFDGFNLRGQLVKFTWDAITRTGYLQKFKATVHRREDVEWEATFEWISRGENVLPTSFGFEVPDILGMAAEVASAVAALAHLITAPFALFSSLVNLFNSALATINDSVAAVTNAVNSAQRGVTTSLSAVKTSIGALQSIQDQTQTIIDGFNAVPDRAKLSLAASPSPSLRVGSVSATIPAITTVTYGQALEAGEYSRQVRLAARQVKVLAAQRQQELDASSINQSLLAIVTARGGMDLRDVARTYYGTADQWHSLASYNKLTNSKLPIGQIVLVPRVAQQVGV